MRQIIYIASLNTKALRYDGERIKSTLIYESLLRYFDRVTIINLSKNKFFETIKMIFTLIFCKNRFQYFVISKDPRGGKIIEKILNFTGVNQDKIIYFEIGPFLYNMLINNDVKPILFSKNKYVVVETNSMKNELQEFGFNNVVVFPNFKHKPKIIPIKKSYPKRILNLVYFSRIEEKKGIYGLVEAIKLLNEENQLFSLDIYGMFMSKNDNERLMNSIKNRGDISYKGKLDLYDLDSYRILEKYDLHVFPTLYDEGFPGTLIDFFFVGVPTVSSSFLRSKDILSDADSFIYKQGSFDDLVKKLLEIYNNQQSIADRIDNTYNLGQYFTIDAFDVFLKELFDEK